MPVCVVPPLPWPGQAEQPELRDGTAAGGPPGEQHNIFHNEVKAIGPHLAKVCAWGGVKGTRGRRGSCLQPPTLTRVLGLILRSRTVNLQAKYQKLLVRRSPGPGWEGTGSQAVGEEVCAVNTSSRR